MSLVAHPTDAPPTVRFPPVAGRRHLLVVDDEEGPRQALQMVFQDDYEVHLAPGGAEALEIIRSTTVDAAILDIRMAGMSGIDLLQRIKSLDPAIEIIMLTAYESIETVRQALKHGACDYINKPFEVKAVRQSVAGAMARRNLSEEVRNNTEKLALLQSELQNQQILQEISRGRGEIYASIIHDINGPLTVISGFVQLMIARLEDVSRIEGGDLGEIRSRLRLITRQVTNCIEISQRYLGLLRRQPANGHAVRANQVLADLGELVRVHPAVQGHQLQILPLHNDMLLKINGTDFIQILLNFIINACQCSPEPHRVDVRGQPRFFPLNCHTLASGPNEIALNLESFANIPPFLMMTIEDNGPGIPSELLNKIFQPYFTTKTSGRGTGLGLAIVHRLVREARGILHVRSLPGEGSAFNLYLPAMTLTSPG